MMEIGSIYEIDPRVIELAGEKTTSFLHLSEIDKYQRENTVFTASGREAIALSLTSMEKEYPAITKKCILPAYMCDTVFIPFEQNGWELFFYHINENLEADLEDLQRLTKNIKPGLLFIHDYYGVDTWKPMRSFLRTCKETGTLIMRDMTQSYYLQSHDTFTDYMIGSLRKWYPVPDGGFVTTNHTIDMGAVIKDDYFSTERSSCLTNKWRYLYRQDNLDDKVLIKQNYLTQNRQLEDWLDHIDHVSSISGISVSILQGIVEEDYKKKRNKNYNILYLGLKDINCLSYPFKEHNKDIVPLYFPIYTENRESLQSYLREHDIYAPVLWPIGKANEEILNEQEKFIYSSLLALPMDARYGEIAMLKIIDTIKQFDQLV